MIRGMNKSKSGFTIVELLIVIVVIAILAAISIVAYSGVQQRARDSKRISDVNAIVAAFRMIGAESGNDFGDISAGMDGNETGWFDSPYATYPSVKSFLVASSYLPEGVQDPVNSKSPLPAYAYMIAPCTSGDDSTRIILARLEKPPTQTVSEQIGMSCTGSFTTYTGSYGMNYGRVVRL